MDLCITGAGGWLGGEIIDQALAGDSGLRLIAVSSNPRTVDERVSVRLTPQEFLSQYPLSRDCVVVHCAFCRCPDDGGGLTESMEYSRDVFVKAARCHVRGIVNLSSQSVYGPADDHPFNENERVSPNYLYSLSKSASELLLDVVAEMDSETLNHSNIRLASLIGVSGGKTNKNVLYHFVRKAMNGDEIKISGGNQIFSFLDIRDAASALLLFSLSDPALWGRQYNLGPEEPIGIVSLAEKAIDTVRSVGYRGSSSVIVDSEESFKSVKTMIDSSTFYSEFDRRPRYSVEDTALEIVRWIEENER